jgi:hypothetical protein
MENGLKYHGSWDNACPSGVSYTEHVQSLPLMLVQMYWQAGGTGIFAVHPMIASMLSVVDPARFGSFKFHEAEEWPVVVGAIGGISVWADVSIGGAEILIVDEPGSLQPHARVTLSNFIDVPEVLDRMARL